MSRKPRRRASVSSNEPGALTSGEVGPILEPYLAHGGGVVLAVSGGPDSVALMRFAAALRPPRNAAPAIVATVDHGLRPESRREAEAVAGWAEACGLPHRILTWTGGKPATGLQEAAREARYRLLASLVRESGASHLLTAHHGDDQAETVLMRLARGSGPSGLAGMDSETPLHGVVVARPFLGLRKARLVATCRAQGWPFLEDPSNAEPGFARTRFRRLLPLLEAEGLTPARLSRLASRLRRWNEVVERSADRAFAATALEAGERIVLDGTKLREEPDEVIVRVLSRAMGMTVRDGRPPRLDRLEHLTDALIAALRRGRRFKANLGGALVETARDRQVTIRPEPPRRRILRRTPPSDAAGAPHSLGTE